MRKTPSMCLLRSFALITVYLGTTFFAFSHCAQAANQLPSQNEKQQKTISIEDINTENAFSSKSDEHDLNRSEDFLASEDYLKSTPSHDGDDRNMAMENALKDATSKNCSEKVDGKRSSINCKETKENGAIVTTETFIAEEVDEYKKQTVVSEISPAGNHITKRSMRLKREYDFRENQKEMKTEYFDVVTRSTDQPVIRELMIREYDPKTHQITKLTWTKYRQIEESKFAEIENHVALSFSPNGEPLRGRVEKWKDGQVSKTLSRWNESNLRFKSSEWQSWQSQISTMMSQIVTA